MTHFWSKKGGILEQKTIADSKGGNSYTNWNVYTSKFNAMIDTIYFALGTLVEMGVKPEALFEIVQEANMSKLWADGKPHFNEMGKTIKPEGWQDPHEKLKAAIKEMEEA